MKGRMQRIGSKVVAAPFASLAGLFVVPILHVGLQLNRVQSATIIGAVESRTVATTIDVPTGRAIADAVHLGARAWHLQDTSCVARSLVCWALCRRRGIDAVIRIGMDPETRRAHAWVEIDHNPVDDTADVAERYLPFDRALASDGSGE